MKKLLSKCWPWLLTLALGLAVYLFWRVRYPFALTFQEQLQLFLFDGDYFCERLAEPGGLARWVAEFLVQFYNRVAIGALVPAVLLMAVQRLTWRLMRTEQHYVTSFLPVMLLWYAMGDENVMLTYVVALLLAMLATWLLATIFLKWGRTPRMLVRKVWWMLLLIPLLYWLLGPMVLLPTLFLMPIGVVYALALMWLSAFFLPYPLSRLIRGIDYYRIPEVLPFVLVAIPLAIWLIGSMARALPKGGLKTRVAGVVAIVAIGLLLVPRGFNAKEYELMEYDHLVRINDWNAIIAKAEQQSPDLPMSVSATNLALAMTGQLGERAFDFYQRGTEGLLPKFERNYATTQLTGEIYYHLGMVNAAQHFAFEAMEAIPNYNKSARTVKRLAETNLINGQYDVARKYLQLLEKTIFYRLWARRLLALLGNEQQINAHPQYGTLRQYQLREDFLFSDRELDKICGQLFLHNQQNMMAAQYLLLMPLLDRDVDRFMAYAPVVQSRIRYNPRSCQEAIAYAYMQLRQQPPQGAVATETLQRMNDFMSISTTDRSPQALSKFRNTLWYYLLFDK